MPADLRGERAAACAAQLRAGLSALRHDVTASMRLCGRDFGALGRELLAALARRERRERALRLARDAERRERERLATRVVELQGNLRVLCRVRPRLPREAEQRLALEAAAGEVRVLASGAGANAAGAGPETTTTKSFPFLRVLSDREGQAAVFQEVAPLVRAAADGHHACVFAYGQTGAGKTYTLQGDPRGGDRAGVYDRAARLLFEATAERAELFHFSLALQMVEVYNEEIYDLLASTALATASTTAAATATDSTTSPTRVTPSTPANARSTNPLANGIHVGATSMFAPPPLPAGSSPPVGEIRQGEDGVFLKNVASVPVHNAQDVLDSITLGSGNRNGGSNSSGDRASRSHSVVLVQVTRTSTVDGTVTAGKLVFIDLAGSERLSKSSLGDTSHSVTSSSSTQAATLALREAQHINKSLAAVGDVLAAVLAREKHVPFRNSKLTHLLQDSLNGGARSHALVLIHVSPTAADAAESINSLKFAARVSRPPQLLAGRHRALRSELMQQRTEVAKLNQVVSTQAAQLQALQEKLTAETELRKRCEKKLEEDAATKKKLMQAIASTRRSSTSPPDGRRWSLYSRKDPGFSIAPPNGIENVAENILRSRDSGMTKGVMPSDDLVAGSTAKPTNVSSSNSVQTTPTRRLPRPSPTEGDKRKRARSPGMKSPAKLAVRSILKKQRGNDGQPKQVSFDLTLRSNSPQLPPPAPRQPISTLRTPIPTPARRILSGATRVLTSSSASSYNGSQSSPARRAAVTTPLRRKPKWNAGWR